MEFNDRILDNVHGFIDITPCEKEIIDLPIFKRLQHIKQLSLVNWVFPGSEHTRYIHSLGVMHIADQMAIHLEYDEEHRVLLRLAGLLHDLGHYPLSHEGESAYMDEYEDLNFSQSLKKKAINKIDRLDRKPSLTRMEVHKTYHHEIITSKVIQNSKSIHDIINRYYPENQHPLISIENICHIITGNTYKKELSGLVQLMHSELDADRIDYLMRDATFSGTCYGDFELGYLLRNLRKVVFKEHEIIGISPKGIAIAEQFLINRFFSYNQVVFNKHVAILGMMVSSLIKEYRIGYGLMNKTELIAHINAHETTELYKVFTDIAFWTILHKEKTLRTDILTKIAESLVSNEEVAKTSDEFIMIASGSFIKQKLLEAPIYNNLLNVKDDNNKLFLYHELSITNQIPFDEYRRIKEEENYNEDLWDVKLFQEGIVVIYDDNNYKLLVDCNESLISQLYDKKLVIMREYTIKK